MPKNLLLYLVLLIATGEGVWISLNLPQDQSISKEATEQAKRDAKAAQAQANRLQLELKASRDSTDLMTNIAMNFKIDSRKAEIAAQQAQKQHEHEKASFTYYPTDSVRLWELARFVPSVLSYRHDHLETEDRGKLR